MEVKEDLLAGTKTATWSGEYSIELPDCTLEYFQTFVHQTNIKSPADSRFDAEAGDNITLKNGRRLELRTWIELESDTKIFHVRATRRISENGKQIRERTLNESFPRDFQ